MSLKIGAHVSVAGGIDKSFSRSEEIGGNAFQIFSKSPRGWNFAYDSLSSEEIQKSKSCWKNFNQMYGVIHSVYLVNLAKPFDLAQNDINSVIDDFKIANQTGFSAVNIHLGKFGDYSKNQAIDFMVENVGYILSQIKDLPPKFVFENTAGQGTEIGRDFEELGFFYKKLLDKLDSNLVKDKIKFCVDTAHAWGAGYDINNWDGVLDIWQKHIGLKNLFMIHFNDSKAILGSKLDRHASLGSGFIGLPALSKVAIWANQNDVPLILETPEVELRPQEISMIKHIIDGKLDSNWIKAFHDQNYQTQYLKKFEKDLKVKSLFE